MSGQLRKELFETYREGQGEISSAEVYANTRAQWPYYDANYLALVQGLRKEADILEIGSGPGSLLAWLTDRGFTNLTGIDASVGDVEFSNKHLGRQVVICGNGLDHLEANVKTYDAIFMKAILEHQPKQDLLPFIAAASAALRQGGLLLVDVPNMDWLFAGHERYMDLTHEVGFTRESLTTLLQLRFKQVEVSGSKTPHTSWSKRVLRKMVVGIFRYATYVLGEGAGNVLFESRSIISVARKPKMIKTRLDG